jgi:hypothetical protein
VDPDCIDMIGQMITHALLAAAARIAELNEKVQAQLAGWNPEGAVPIRVTVPPKDDLTKDRRSWKPA